MKRWGSLTLSIILLLATFGVFAGLPTPTTNPLPSASAAGDVVSIFDQGPQAGHYLQWHGQPILLIGDSVTQGWMESGPNFDQHAYVDALAERGMNLLMLWSYIGTSASKQEGDSRLGYDAPELWPWQGSPDDRSFDLTQFNQAYFDRLKDLVSYAESKDIVVLITLHDGWTKGYFDHHPFNAALGNGPLTDRMQYVELADYHREMPAAYDPSWTWQEKNQYFQERFADKLINELKPYSNVIYEMFNEGNKYDQTLRNQHEQHFLAFFRARTDKLLLTNTDHIQGDDPHHDAKVDVITLHGDWTQRFGDFQGAYNTSPAKPYLLSEPVPGWDGSNVSLDDIRRSVWEVAMAGAGWVNQNDLSFGWDANAAIASQAALRDQAYDYAGHAARFFNQSGLRFWEMRPAGHLSSTGIALAQEGLEYAIYAPNGGGFSVDLSAAGSGVSFSARWYNPRSGEFSLAGTVQGGARRTFNAPDSQDWVLHLVASGAPVAYDGTLTTQVNTSATGTLSASDPDGDPLTFRILTNGSKGTAVITDAASGAFRYTPNPDVSGSDAFTFVANDGQEDSNPATVHVTILSDDPGSGVIVTDLSAASGRAYQAVTGGLQDGAVVYIDREFAYSQVPAHLLGATYILTANDDKESTASSFLSFEVDQDVTVYVAHDNRITAKPSWLQSFTDTGQQLITDVPSRLYRRSYPPGRITLGGNQAPGTAVKSSMYTVILTPAEGQVPPAFFEDVPQDHWAYTYIKDLYDQGYLSGCSRDPLLYCTGQGMNRAEASVFVDRGVEGAAFHPPVPAAPPFSDVPLSHWAVEWVDYLKSAGFTSGCGSDPQGQPLFCPEAVHTRAEAPVFFYRMLNGPEAIPPAPDAGRAARYADVAADNSIWYNKWIYAALDAGILGDCEDPPNQGDALYRPDDPLLREEAACMMHRAIYAGQPPTPTPTPTVTPTPTPTPTPGPTPMPNPDGALHLGEEVYIADGSSPDIAVDGQGNLHIVYRASDGAVTYLRYTPQGLSAPRIIAPQGSQPRIAIDNQDNPHVVYISADDVMYTKMQDGAFITPLVVQAFPDRTEKPRIAIDRRDNTAFVLYEHVGEKEGADPDTAWVFYYNIIDNSGPTPLIGPRVHPPTNRTAGYVEEPGAVVFDSQGTAHYFWRDWGDRKTGSRGLHYQSRTPAGDHSQDLLLHDYISDFIDASIDPQGHLYVITTTGWATQGLLYATNRGGSWNLQTHFVELFSDEAGNGVFDPDHNVPSIAYDPGRGLAYIAFSAGETEIHHSFEYIDSYIAYVDGQGNFSPAILLHDPERASGSKYNGVRIAAARNQGVFALIPRLRLGTSDKYEIILRAVGGAQVGPP